MPYPSKGCYTCRKRKIKCDGGRPVCAKCRLGNRQCDGYALSVEGFAFRDENAFAQGQQRRRDVVHRLPEPDEWVENLQQWTVAKVPRQLEEQLSEHALNFYINAQIASNQRSEFLKMDESLLGDVLGRSASKSSLRVAVAATSHAIYGLLQHNDDAMRRGMTLYAKALALVANDIGNIKAVPIDEIMLACAVLKRYEHVSYSLKAREGGRNPFHTIMQADSGGKDAAKDWSDRFQGSFSHHDGAMALLRVKLQSDGNAASTELARLVRRSLIRTSILRMHPLPEFLRDGLAFEPDPKMYDFYQLLCRIIDLRVRSKTFEQEFLMSAPGSVDDCYKVVGGAKQLDRDLVAWSEQHCQDIPFTQRSVSLADRDSTTATYRVVHIYKRKVDAGIWNQFRAARLIVNSIIARLTNIALTKGIGEAVFGRAIAIAKVEDIATSIIESMPFFLGEVELRPTSALPSVYPTPFSLPSSSSSSSSSLSPASRASPPVGYPMHSPLTKTFTSQIPDEQTTGFELDEATEQDVILVHEPVVAPGIAINMAWALSVACSIREVPAAQRQVLQARLVTVAAAIGDQILETIAGTQITLV